MHKSLLVTALAGLMATAVHHVSAQCVVTFTSLNTTSTTVVFSTQPVSSGTQIIYTWDFGDNTFPVTVVNTPSVQHIYNSNGAYNVTLHYQDSASAGCVTVATNTLAITQGSCNDAIDFTWTAGANGFLNFYGSFMNNPNYVYVWDFGDGSVGASGFSSTHTYSANGVYTVVLTASTTPAAICSYSVAKVLTVNIVPCPINASFTTAIAGNQVTLTSNSSGTGQGAMYQWHLGDGSTSWGPGVVHTYSNNGSYNAMLIVSDSSSLMCQDTAFQTVAITSGSCLLNVSFVVSKDSSQPLTWYVYPYVSGGITATQWNWGDGSTSNSLYTTHTFSAAGMYNICLSATASCGSNTTVCVASNIYRTAGSDVISVIVKQPVTSLHEPQSVVNKLAIFPNPSAGNVTIKMPDQLANEIATVSIFDITGKTVFSGSTAEKHGHELRLDLRQLPPGSYIVQISGNGQTAYGRLVLTE